MNDQIRLTQEVDKLNESKKIIIIKFKSEKL